MLRATARTYRRGADEEEFWRCPCCGRRNWFEFPEDDGMSKIDICVHCEAEVEVTYRRMFRKNY